LLFISTLKNEVFKGVGDKGVVGVWLILSLEEEEKKYIEKRGEKGNSDKSISNNWEN